MKKETIVQYVYICSAPFSGSTLLSLLLGAHSSIFSIGELSHFPKNISQNTLCSCGAKIRNCEIWSKVLKELLIYKKDFLNYPYKFNLWYIKPFHSDYIHKTITYKFKRKIARGLKYLALSRFLFLEKFVNRLFDFEMIVNNTYLIYNLCRKVSKKEIILDSSKHYLKAIELYRYNPKNFRILLLVRDGRGVVYSCMKRGFSLKESVKIWKNAYKRALVLLNKYVSKEHYLFVKYENLVKNPEKVLRDICNFLNISFEYNMLTPANFVYHLVDGNKIRFSKITSLKLDVSWKKALSKENLKYFKEKAGALNKYFGYE